MATTQDNDGTKQADSHESGTTGVNAAERARYIRLAWNKHGRPPSQRMVGEESPYGDKFYHSRHQSNWDEVLREQAGVPGHDDVIVAALRERYADRYPWQDSIVLRSKWLADDTGLNADQIGRALQKFVDGERTHEGLSELSVSRCVTGSGHTKWRVGSQ